MPNHSEPKTNKLTIYLIKQGFDDLDDIVESKQEPIGIEDLGHFVFEESHPNRPDWVTNFFGSTLDNQESIFTSSAKGVVVIPVETSDGIRHFVVSFGVGRHLLKDGVVEERFGLKIVLNSVDANSFRSIDKTTLGSIPKHSREQMSKDVTPAEFGIDIEQDLISSVTGKSRDQHLGKTVTGKDALHVSVKVDMHNIGKFLEYCYERYKSLDYKTDFDWIDQIAEVRNKVIQDQLNDELMRKITQNDLEKVWMAVPEVVDWSDIQGFRYLRQVRGNLHDDLDIPTFFTELGRIPQLQELKNATIFAISSSTDDTLYKWSVFKCMYAECRMNNKLYILNNSKWYEIAKGFCDEVERDYIALPRSSVDFPECTMILENEYNQLASSVIPGACCMDRQIISHGGGRSSVEFCDIYTTSGKMIHVKKYGGSSMLSHLFSQGVVSGELFVTDSDFRAKLNRVLPPTHRIADTDTRPMTPNYEIVYGIISNSLNELDIPFFSKVSLRNARRRLTGYGYDVSLKKIQRL